MRPTVSGALRWGRWFSRETRHIKKGQRPKAEGGQGAGDETTGRAKGAKGGGKPSTDDGSGGGDAEGYSNLVEFSRNYSNERLGDSGLGRARNNFNLYQPVRTCTNLYEVGEMVD
jgi:hypothetical protein